MTFKIVVFNMFKDFGGCSESASKHSCPHPGVSIYTVRETKLHRNHDEHSIIVSLGINTVDIPELIKVNRRFDP